MSTLKCHRCEKICTSKGGLTNHIKNCIDKSKKNVITKPKNDINKSKCIICNTNISKDNSVKFNNCKKYIHNGCLRLSKNIESLHCHSVFCKPEMFHFEKL
jgi:hypothetical protein